MIKETLSVNAIKIGTVIDHLPSGQAINILRYLSIGDQTHPMTLGLNLPSKRLNKKDLIKISGLHLIQQEANEIAIFAPNATINLIDNFTVVEKLKITMPTHIKGIFQCENKQCVTNAEPIESHFDVKHSPRETQLICYFCEKPRRFK
jgi:aspartate carbamoyltransferase regulatory subunit